jgi:hypothetical protein
MTRTSHLAAAALSFVLAATIAPASRGDPITYSIQNYPSLQNGYTLSGEITTDGTIGPLTGANITAWSYTITKGTIADHESGPDPSNIAGITGEITASPTRITAASPGTGSGPNILSFLRFSAGGSALQYERSPGPPLGSDSYFATLSNAHNLAWATGVDNPPGLSLGGDPWIIALLTVPEPGPLTLALLGFPGLAAAVLWTTRRNRAASRPAVSPTAHS